MLDIHLLYDTAIPFLGIFPRETEFMSLQKPEVEDSSQLHLVP